MTAIPAEQRDHVAALLRTALPYLRLPRGSTVEDVSVAVSEDAPPGVVAYFGTHVDDETGAALLEITQRFSLCYALAGRALTFPSIPTARLIHGSIQRGPGPRIGHAWLELDDVLVWEPVTALIHESATWRSWAGAWEEATYIPSVARRHILASGHFGRWHESRYP